MKWWRKWYHQILWDWYISPCVNIPRDINQNYTTFTNYIAKRIHSKKDKQCSLCSCVITFFILWFESINLCHVVEEEMKQPSCQMRYQRDIAYPRTRLKNEVLSSKLPLKSFKGTQLQYFSSVIQRKGLGARDISQLSL